MATGSPDYVTTQKDYVQKYFLPVSEDIKVTVYSGEEAILASESATIDITVGEGYYRQLLNMTLFSDNGCCYATLDVSTDGGINWGEIYRISCHGVFDSYILGFENYSRAMIFLPAWKMRLTIHETSSADSNIHYVVSYGWQEA